MPTIDLSFSKENDYTARSAGISDAWTMLEGRGTLHFGLAVSSDIVAPTTNDLKLPKRSEGYSLGWTWILGEKDLFDVSASLMRLSGYLDDPYKVVPIGSPESQTNMPEHRPNSRARYALVGRYGHHTSGDSAIKATYRFYTDDWGIRAHTLELEYEMRLGSGWIVSPQARLYVQSAASFYGSLFVEPQQFMSADYRLSPFSSLLGGLKVSHEIFPGLDAYVAVTLQTQTGRDRVSLPGVSSGDEEGRRSVSAADLSEEGLSRQSVSAADMKVTTVTFGFRRRF
jgi:hypothetical protein